jgi:hypothetical protein
LSSKRSRSSVATCGRLALLGLVLLFQLAPQAGPVLADQPSQAGLVIRFDDGRLVTRCVAFQGGETTGSELLARSGLAIVIDSTHGGGITVCKIEGTGCDYPVDACFCQCMGNGPCGYWNYFYRQPGQEEWVYSPQGALIHQVKPGSVEAWVWGDGHTPPDPALTFDVVCAARPTPAPGAMLPTLTPTLSPEGRGGTEGEMLSSYWPFGFLILVLIGIGAYLRLGRR